MNFQSSYNSILSKYRKRYAAERVRRLLAAEAWRKPQLSYQTVNALLQFPSRKFESYFCTTGMKLSPNINRKRHRREAQDEHSRFHRSCRFSLYILQTLRTQSSFNIFILSSQFERIVRLLVSQKLSVLHQRSHSCLKDVLRFKNPQPQKRNPVLLLFFIGFLY